MAGMKKLTSEMPNGQPRDDIVQQPDELDSEEFLANARIWLRMARTT
jgi:hypothetical protein